MKQGSKRKGKFRFESRQGFSHCVAINSQKVTKRKIALIQLHRSVRLLAGQ